ncbi:hypothetical protein QUA07_17110 [Microcoleus sp. T3_A4]|uniref:hypothetical protein n=1 Tax=Microcoleus sp. T3_A4 TaxID=2818968 RepID=UPI002FD663C8
MVIRVDFLIKHICLTGMDAWESICNPRDSQSLAAWYSQNGLTNVQIEKCLDDWAKIAQLDINHPQNIKKFISVAQNLSDSREKELGNRFKYSTMLFLNDRLYRELNEETTIIADILFSDFGKANSQIIPGKNKDCREFDYKPSEPIPLAINISRKPGIPPEVFRNVMGVTVGVDSKGNCIHFGKLTGGVAV